MIEKYGQLDRDAIRKIAMDPPNQADTNLPGELQAVKDEFGGGEREEDQEAEQSFKPKTEAQYEPGPKGGDTSEYRPPYRILDLGKSYEGANDPISGRQIDIGRYVVLGRDSRRDGTLQPIESSDDEQALREAWKVTGPISEVLKGGK